MYPVHLSLLVLLALHWTPSEVLSKNLPELELNPAAVASLLAVENEQQGIPSELEFEAGGGDSKNNQLVENTREKRTLGNIGRMTTCLFTFLFNPNCMNQMNQQQSTYQRSYQSSPSNNYYQQQMQYLQQQLAWQRAQNLIMSRYNGSDSNSSTNYPYPILSTYPPEQQPTESPTEQPPPSNPILDIINAKINFVPNMLRMFFPGLFGNQNRMAYNRPSNNPYSYNNNNNLFNQGYNRNSNNNLFG